MNRKTKKNGIAASAFRFLILGAACAVFLYSGTRLWSYFAENRANEKDQQELIDQAVVILKPQENVDSQANETLPDGETTPVPEETEPTEPPLEPAPIYVDFEKLKQQNEDIIGWIYCPDTIINYPIIQGEDNQSYLYRTHEGIYNANGCIFMDFRNLSDFSDHNNIVYGHNMPTGAMFGSLKHYREQSYYEEHPVFWILTPDKAFRVDLIAGLVTPSDSDTYELFSYAEDLQARMEYAISKSTFDAGEVDIQSIEHVVTLSTCTYEYATARYVVIGVLSEAGYPEPPEVPETTEP